MHKPSLFAPRLLPVWGRAPLTALALLVVVLASCGGQPTSGLAASPSSRAKPLTAKTSPCTLLTQTQVEQILKTSMTVGVPPTNSAGNFVSPEPCTYRAVPGDLPTVLLLLTIFDDVAAARANFHTIEAKLTSQGGQAIAGLGEGAIPDQTSAPILMVQQDNGMVTIGVISAAPAAVVADQEEHLAQLAVQKM